MKKRKPPLIAITILVVLGTCVVMLNTPRSAAKTAPVVSDPHGGGSVDDVASNLAASTHTGGPAAGKPKDAVGPASSPVNERSYTPQKPKMSDSDVHSQWWGNGR